jgi:hypothetical protein
MPLNLREYAPLSFIAARLLAAGLLFWAVVQPSLHDSVVFLCVLCAIGILGIVRAVSEEVDWFLLLFYFVFAFGFAPFLTHHYGQLTWAILDITIGILLILSIFLLDSGPFDPFVRRADGKMFVAVISIGFGVAWILFGGFLIYESTKPLTRTLKIKMDGVETQARVTRVLHRYDARDDGNGGTTYYDVFVTEYVFSTENGLLIDGVAELSENLSSTLSVEEFREKYPEGREIQEGVVIPLGVEYEKNNPANNRAFDNRHGIFTMILVLVIWTAIGIAFAVMGYFVCLDNKRRLVASGR